MHPRHDWRRWYEQTVSERVGRLAGCGKCVGCQTVGGWRWCWVGLGFSRNMMPSKFSINIRRWGARGCTTPGGWVIMRVIHCRSEPIETGWRILMNTIRRLPILHNLLCELKATAFRPKSTLYTKYLFVFMCAFIYSLAHCSRRIDRYTHTHTCKRIEGVNHNRKPEKLWASRVRGPRRRVERTWPTKYNYNDTVVCVCVFLYARRMRDATMRTGERERGLLCINETLCSSGLPSGRLKVLAIYAVMWCVVGALVVRGGGGGCCSMSAWRNFGVCAS